jgi:hypothetical protein
VNFESYFPVVKDGFLFEPIPEGCMLFEEASGKLITLNEAAEAVLTFCDGEHSVADICRDLERDLHLSEQDVRKALGQLAELGVVQTCGGGIPPNDAPPGS